MKTKAKYIKCDDALRMLDGIYDCNDMVFENDSCVGRDCASCRWYDTKKYIRGRMANLPAADVAPVRHGSWIKHENDDAIRCSVCGFGLESFIAAAFFRFCPFCGALMDKDGDGE